ARLTLDAGFTTVRDVGNEGSGYADVALRDAIERGLVDGPRMRVATRGIAAIGQYYPFGVSSDLHAFPTGSQMVSGVDEVRRAVATAQEVGVPIALGSDPGETDRHGRNAEELVAMARRGLSPLDAVRSATSLAAELMGMSGDIGTVEAGKYADLIGVEGDPLQ